MANTYTLIASNTLSSSAASVTFSSIPSTYTDLVVKISARSAYSGGNLDYFEWTFNGLTTSIYSGTFLYYLPTSVGSNRFSSGTKSTTNAMFPASTATSNTFSSTEIYIPSYTASQNKPYSLFTVAENNSSTDYGIDIDANLIRTTSAISSMTFTGAFGSNFVSGSSFFLYGIKSS
jgi:hypothetical protein